MNYKPERLPGVLVTPDLEVAIIIRPTCDEEAVPCYDIPGQGRIRAAGLLAAAKKAMGTASGSQRGWVVHKISRDTLIAAYKDLIAGESIVAVAARHGISPSMAQQVRNGKNSRMRALMAEGVLPEVSANGLIWKDWQCVFDPR